MRFLWQLPLPQWLVVVSYQFISVNGPLHCAITRAVSWLSWARWLGFPSARDLCLQARIDRKLSRFDRFSKSIEQAQKAGNPPAKIQLEKLLAITQAGRLEEIEPRLGKLLIDHNEDSAEICEAFVLGCLLN
jgi:hypothetical protein